MQGWAVKYLLFWDNGRKIRNLNIMPRVAPKSLMKHSMNSESKLPEALNFYWSCCIPGSRWAEVRRDSSRQYNEDLFAFLRWVGRPAACRRSFGPESGQTDDQEEVQTSKVAVFISLLMMQMIPLGSRRVMLHSWLPLKQITVEKLNWVIRA